MIHLEGYDKAPENEELFNIWVNRIMEVADLLEKYNAKGTFEAKPNFVKACKNFDDNVLLKLYERGHGIGVHADVGAKALKEGKTVEDITDEIKIMKKNTEALLGHQVRHVSGICSGLDWVKAAIDAGYKFTTGGVTMCGFSLLEENLPKGYTKKKILSEFHGVFPPNLEDRIHPWRTSDGKNWLEHDPGGQLVILSSDGVIKALYELHNGDPDAKEDAFNQNDIDTYISLLEESLNYSEADKVNLLYVGLSIGGEIEKEVFEKWLEEIQPYINSGKAKWKTLPEIYDAYIAMEK